MREGKKASMPRVKDFTVVAQESRHQVTKSTREIQSRRPPSRNRTRAMPASDHMPWLWNTLLHDLDSFARFDIRQDCTAPSLPSSLRQKRCASREQARCSCRVP
jgi:hypothetical protein